MNSHIIRIDLRQGASEETYYEPTKLTKRERANLVAAGWKVRETKIEPGAEIRRIDPVAALTDMARCFSGGSGPSSSMASTYSLAAGYREQRVKQVRAAAEGLGSLRN